MHDLFGNEVKENEINSKKIYGKYKGWKNLNNYRKSEDKEKRCKNCLSLCGYEYHNKRYYKCEMMGCSHSEASDIRLSYICDQFIGSKK